MAKMADTILGKQKPIAEIRNWFKRICKKMLDGIAWTWHIGIALLVKVVRRA